MDLSKLSDKDLIALSSGGVQALSDEGLKSLSSIKPPAKKELSWGEVAKGAVKNLPGSAMNIVKGISNTIMHPIDTLSNVNDVIGGGIQNALPESVNKVIGQNLAAREKARAVGNYFADRYGSTSGFKEALATDPAGVLADASTLLTGGGMAAAKIPALAKVGQSAAKIGAAIDPLTLAAKGVAPVAKTVGSGLANTLGTLGTRTGAESLKAAAAAGMKGGQVAREFADNLRGKVPMTDVLEEVKAAMGNLRTKKAEQYTKGMTEVGKNNAILDFAPVDSALAQVKEIGTFKGKTVNRSAADAQNKISEVITEWKNSDPAVFHTVEGFDALKRTIGDIRDSTELGTPSRAAADKAYHAVKKEIVAQAPEYAKIMQDYETASGLIKEIKDNLSINNRAMADTAMRKLLSVTKNSPASNKAALLGALEDAGAANLLSNLHAQALESWAPKGLGNLIAAGGVLSQSPYALPIIAAQSPRAMGEAALAIGRGAGGVSKAADSVNALANRLGTTPGVISNYLYQLDSKSNQGKK